MLLCYVSGHGFGHAVRVMEVVRALWRRSPSLGVMFRTPIPRWLFDFNLSGPFDHQHVQLDIGAVQDDSLSVDPAATLRTYAEIASDAGALVDAEVDALRAHRPALVFSDIPAIAFDVAKRLGVAAFAMTNFSWDWIYDDYVRDHPEYSWLVSDLRSSYGRASLLLRLPLHGDLSAFPRIRDIPFVARHATLDRREARRRLGLSQSDRVVLLSFGGIGVNLHRVPSDLQGVTFVITEAGQDAAPPPCRVIPIAQMTAAGVRYQDLVGAVDAVMTKPGYGITAECIANRTAIVYTDRGRFVEYPFLVDGIRKYLPNAFVSNHDLYAGRWQQALEEVFAQPWREVEVATNGADVAADILLSSL